MGSLRFFRALRLLGNAILLHLCVTSRADTQIIVWGDNSAGQLDLPNDLTNVVAIAAGYNHTLALRADSTVTAWGANNVHQIDVPVGLSNVVAIAAGGAQSLALKADGTLIAWGFNAWGQATVPSGLSNVVGVACGGAHNLALKADGMVVAWGNNDGGRTDVPSGLSNVVAVAGGELHSLALLADGRVVAWGYNYYGQCTVPIGLEGVVGIAAGEYHSVAVKADGTVEAWGAGSFNVGTDPYHGQSIVPPGLTNVAAVAACGHNSGVLRADGTVVAWGSNTSGQTNVPTDLAYVSAIAMGFRHCAVLVGSGPPFLIGPFANRTGNYYSTVFLHAAATGASPLSYQWKFNDTDLPGATNATVVLSQIIPAQAGAYSVVVSNLFGRSESSSLMVGVVPAADIQPLSQANFVGSTVTLSTTASKPAPLNYQWQFNDVDLPGATNSSLVLTNAQLSQAGLYAVVVSGPAGSVRSANARVFITQVAVWELDQQSNVPTRLTNAVAVAGGIFHTLALSGDGTVVGWGFGNYGANNDGQAEVPVGLSNVIAIAAGEFHSLALKADGTVAGWGFGSFGLTVAPVDLTNAVAIAAGEQHNLALRADGTVAVWGSDAYGQMNVPPGLSNVVKIAAADLLSLALKVDGTVAAWGGFTQPIVPSEVTNVVSIAAGGDHALALKKDGSVLAWSLDGSIQTDVPAGLTNVVMITAGTGLNLAMKADGTVVAWPGTVPPGVANVTMLAAGYNYHYMAVVKGVFPALHVPMTDAAWSPSGFKFSLPTQSGSVYALESKNSLADTNWVRLSLHAGNGGILSLTDPAVTNPQRFYRVRQW